MYYEDAQKFKGVRTFIDVWELKEHKYLDAR